MPYIFVRGTLGRTGLFTDETFIDFQNVEDGNGEFVGAILSRQLGSYPVNENWNGISQRIIQMQNPEDGQQQPPPGTFQRLGVARPPPVVLNTLEIHAGYKVVAANYQRPLENVGGLTGVSYTVWTLHKPLPWNITADELKFGNYELFFTIILTFVVLPVGLSCEKGEYV